MDLASKIDLNTIIMKHVNLSSIGGIVPIPYQIPYTTSKYAVTGLTKALHAELSPQGIRVCGIYPNFIRTRIVERTIFRGKNEQTARDRHDLVDKAIHTPVLEKPEDVAAAIWQAIEPVAPAAPETTNVSPALSFPISFVP